MKILFFSPNAAIWVHALPEALVAEALMQSGHEITYVTCGKRFDEYCVSMSGFNLDTGSSKEEKERICKLCVSNAHIIRKRLNLVGFDVSEKVSGADLEAVRVIMESVTQENFSDLELDGVPVGRLALYELLLRHKKVSFQFTERQWSDYQVELRNSLFSFFACRRIFSEVKPDRVVLHNSLYSVNHICSRMARNQGVPDYDLYPCGNLWKRAQTLMIGRGGRINLNRYTLKHWTKYRDIPCDRDALHSITNHYLELFKGKNVFAYSEPKGKSAFELRSSLGIRPDQKILVAVMSSYDEIFAAQSIGLELSDHRPIFASQVEWIRFLIDLVKEREDLFLVIRVHPREFPNKRERIRSEHAGLLEKLLSNLPANVRVNWPEEHVSLYDIAEEADVFLCAWSSVAKEMSLLGMPVVIYEIDFLSYPPDLVYMASTLEDYVEKIFRALADGWSLENTRKTYRWSVLEYCRSIITISESFGNVDPQNRSVTDRLKEKLRKAVSPSFRQHSDCRNRKKELECRETINRLLVENKESLLDLLNPQDLPRIGLDEETEFLRIELKILMSALYGDKAFLPSGKGAKGNLRDKLKSFVLSGSGT